MIQCLLLSGSLFLFSPDGEKTINLGEVQAITKDDGEITAHISDLTNYSTLEGFSVDMTLFQVMQQCDNVAWENYDEVVSD